MSVGVCSLGAECLTVSVQILCSHVNTTFYFQSAAAFELIVVVPFNTVSSSFVLSSCRQPGRCRSWSWITEFTAVVKPLLTPSVWCSCCSSTSAPLSSWTVKLQTRNEPFVQNWTFVSHTDAQNSVKSCFLKAHHVIKRPEVQLDDTFITEPCVCLKLGVFESQVFDL